VSAAERQRLARSCRPPAVDPAGYIRSPAQGDLGEILYPTDPDAQMGLATGAIAIVTLARGSRCCTRTAALERKKTCAKVAG